MRDRLGGNSELGGAGEHCSAHRRSLVVEANSKRSVLARLRVQEGADRLFPPLLIVVRQRAVRPAAPAARGLGFSHLSSAAGPSARDYRRQYPDGSGKIWIEAALIACWMISDATGPTQPWLMPHATCDVCVRYELSR